MAGICPHPKLGGTGEQAQALDVRCPLRGIVALKEHFKRAAALSNSAARVILGRALRRFTPAQRKE